MASVAFVGGSLLPLGGQNIIEPASLGLPVVVGPHTFNFTQATQAAIDAKACTQVPDADAVIAVIRQHLQNTKPDASDASLAFYQAHQGASLAIMALIQSISPCIE
jgi:3-deoxy-D-manno-octulosonic-acid transferase